MPDLTSERKGEISVVVSNILWSFFPVINILAFRAIGYLYVAGFSTLVATFFYAAILLFAPGEMGKWHIGSAWKDLLMATFLIGIVTYGLFYWGLSLTTAGNASILSLLEILFTFLFFGIWRREPQQKGHVLGAFCMAAGAFLILFEGGFDPGAGDMIIIGAMTIPPIGNYFQKKVRQKISSAALLCFRNLVSGLFLLFLAFFLQPIPEWHELREALVPILICGILLFGLSKFMWIEALSRLTVPKIISFSGITPFFTLIFAYFLLGEIPSLWQLSGLFPILLGLFFLTRNSASYLTPHESD